MITNHTPPGTGEQPGIQLCTKGNSCPFKKRNRLPDSPELYLEIERFMLDSDFSVLKRFLFKALVMQVEHPELADLLQVKQIGEISMLYDLLCTMNESKAKMAS
ncbi:hypothetical protein [Pontibacter sp. SGAir0037]|uniref:hypothetical protein n=1 Tax=Pontibacter sp. SGAir0037 TaxID=2571030 RepID=UPI0010F9B579|nr:hypothetical protein [Pontibacter sp. SGAir0037]